MSGFFRIFAVDMSKMMPHNYNYELMKHINGDTQMTENKYIFLPKRSINETKIY
ncbi:MAG: hypothetical protein IKH59_04420 [Bacteroidaceae bacterium]|nr:hypothetical protein [Bacteroidaceae bacterium]